MNTEDLKANMRLLANAHAAELKAKWKEIEAEAKRIRDAIKATKYDRDGSQ